EPRDSAPSVLDLEAHHAGTLAVDLDDEPPEGERLPLRALDLGQELLRLPRPARAQERLDVVVVGELDDEVEVARLGSADRRPHRSRLVRRRMAPVPSATPPRTSPRPATAAAVSGSPRKRAP